jgi:hypothetical protein
VATRIQLRRGIASSWTSSNPILASGEVGIETDTNKIKIGDGSSNWTELDYFADVYAASASIIAYINSEIGDLIDSAPALLDTLNELAAAIGDDPSFFSSIRTTINSASATAYSSASAYTNAASASLVSYTNSQINALSTTDIEEGSRLYFTNQRAIDATSSLITSASANALSQANSYTNSASTSLKSYTDSQISALDVFSNIATSPSTQLITGDSNSDTLTFISGENISISADSSTDSITIGVTGIQEQIDNLIASIGPSSASATASRITAYVKNGTTSLAKGVPVYVTGADGTNIIIGPASNASESTSSKTLGFTQTALSANQHGYIVLEGTLSGLDTSLSGSAGDPIWLGETPGTVIYGLANKPQAPNHLVYLGVVSRKNSSNGEIFVKIQNGFELKELHDVRISGVANDDLIVYNSASSIWVNSPKQNIITTASAAAFTSASAYTLSQINALTTTDIEEGTNKYFTDQRAIDAASATYILQTSQQSIINTASAAAVTAVLDGAPGALDTLNELAAALNDDSSFATTVTNSLAAKLDASSASATYLTQSNASASYVAQNSTGNEYIQDQASSLFVHSNHTNVTATYDDANNQVILVGSAGGGSAVGGGASIIVSASAPVGAVEGDAWFDNTDGSFYVYDGTFWVETAPEGSGSTDGGSFTRWSKTYSGSATLISGTDDDLFSLNYYPGLEQVFINGILQDISNYTATSGSTIVLNEAVVNNDVVEVIAVQSFNFADAYTKAEIDQKVSNYTRWTKTMGASATTISGLDDSSLTLSYTVGNEEIFVNGILLTRTTDYTATSGSTVLLVEAVSSGDIVEIKSHEILNVGNLYTQTQADARYEIKRNTYIVNGAYTASINDIIFVNTSASAHTITLPATPVLGHKVLISDLSNNSSTRNITVGRNSEKIDGAEDNFTIDVNNGSVEFIYTNTTYGWRTI